MITMLRRASSRICRFSFGTTEQNNKTLDPVFRQMSSRYDYMDKYLDLREDIFGPNEPLRMIEQEARNLLDESIADMKHFKFQRALESSEKACKLYEEYFNPNFSELMDSILEKSEVETKLKLFDDAIRDIRHVQDLCKKVIVNFRTEMAIYMRFGQTYLAAKNYDKALFYLNRCLDIGLHERNRFKNEVNDALICLGNLYSEKGDWDSALDHYYQALEGLRTTVRTDQPRYYRASTKIGGILLDRGELREAVRLLENALEFYNNNFEEDMVEDVLECYQLYGKMLMSRGVYHSAVKILSKVVEMEAKLEGKAAIDSVAYDQLRLAAKYIGDETEVKRIKEILKKYE